MRLQNKGHNKVLWRRLRFAFFVIGGTWLIQSFSRSVQIHITFVQDEAVNNLPSIPQRRDAGLPSNPQLRDASLPSNPQQRDASLPSNPQRRDAGLPPQPQWSDSELFSAPNMNEIKERMQLERLIQDERREGMEVLSQFRSKLDAKLGRRDTRLVGRDTKLGLRDTKMSFLNDLKHGGVSAREWVQNAQKAYRPTIPTYKRKYPRVLFYVHIHKSAGTLFCRLAYRNRINTNRENNCNVQDDQYCCGGRDTLQAQISFANRTFWDLVAIERELYENMAPDYYDYIVTLRDSKSRYYSHWSHLRRMMPVGPGIQTGGFGNSAWIFGNNTIVNDRIRKRRVPPGEDPLGSFEVWSQGQPDNWNTRIICGAKCRPKPKFQITRELFEYTLQRANRFAHFLFVEDLEGSYNQIARAYRWHQYKDIVNTALLDDQSKRRRDKEGVESRLAEEKWDPLMSALDDALYEFAKRKYNHVSQEELWQPFQNQDMVDRYFAEGYKVGCQNGCCFNCSAY